MIKNIVTHLLIWLICLYLFYNFGDWQWVCFSTQTNTYLVPFLYSSVFSAFLFYLNALYFFQHFKKSKVKYWLLSILIIAIATLIESYIDIEYADYKGVAWTYYDAIVIDDLFDKYYKVLVFMDLFITGLGINFLFWLASFSYLFPKEMFQNIKLEKERLQAELKYLKAQIEPHTLFNGINTVYHLMDENVDQAKSFLLGFSNILRYQVYECKEDKILFSKEISFLDDVFQLWQFRVGEDAQIEWDFEEITQPLFISPLIFYPLVENAFKYLSTHDESSHNQLHASIKQKGFRIAFIISNTYIPNARNEKIGVGLNNVKERLRLLYPKRHRLTIDDQNKTYTIQLTIDLHE